MTPPGGTWGKSLKRGRSSAPGSIQQDLPSAHFPPLPSSPVHYPPPPPQVSVTGRGDSLESAPRWIALTGAAIGGWRPSFWKAAEGSFSTNCLPARGRRGWPWTGAVGRWPPGAVHRDSRPRAAGSTPEPQPDALGALWQQQCPPAPACSGPRPRLYAHPPARSPCGRSRSHRQVALGVWPSPPESRRACPSGHPSRSSARCAPLSPHLRPLAIFTPPSAPARAPDSVLSN